MKERATKNQYSEISDSLKSIQFLGISTVLFLLEKKIKRQQRAFGQQARLAGYQTLSDILKNGLK